MKAFAAVVLMTALLLPADALAGTETVLFSFDLTDGGNPQGILARDSAGNLYGVTQIGGSCGDGTVFRLAGTNETVLHSFGCVNDRHLPIGPVVLDPNGNIYGTTYSFSDADCGT